MTKILSSSTAWFGGIVAALAAFAHTTGFGIPTPIGVAISIAYAIKEAATKIAGGMHAQADATIAATLDPKKDA